VEDHPTAEDFERLLQRSPRPSSTQHNASVVRHLLAGCEVCRTTLRELRGAKPLLSKLLDLPTPADQDVAPTHSYNYEWAFARAERALRSSTTESSLLLSELSQLSEGEQTHQVLSDERFASPKLVHVLIDRGHASRYRNPRKTLHLSLLARLAAEACSAGEVDSVEELADLRAQAWAAFANSQRICGRLFDAEESLAIAFRHAEIGTGSPRVRALLLSHLCSQRVFQRQIEDAIKLAEEAERLAERIGQTSLQAAIMVRRGIALTYGGETMQAIDVFQRAIRMIDPEDDSYLLLAAHHNLVRCYIDLDRPEEALSVFYEARDLYQSHRDPLIVLRATWQEGQLLREVGHLRNAEAALLRARQGFEEQGLAYETAIVCLDLGDVYWKLGQLDQLRRTIAQAVPIFRSLRVEREVLASLLRLQQAAGLELSSPLE